MKITLSSLGKIDFDGSDGTDKNLFLRRFGKNIVRDDLNGSIYHSNVIEYISLCWKNHWGVVFLLI